MGLIKAIKSSVGGVLADQWKEVFSCEAIPGDVLVVKGRKKTSGRSANTKGVDNIITSGSVILVADGQCMMIVDQGKIVEFCSEPGEYTYDASTEPTIFCDNLGEALKATFATMARRITFGGEAPKDQRIYYFNTKEIMDNKFGTPSPVPFRVVDQRAGLDIDINVRCFGTYTYRIINPMAFYKNVCGNVSADFSRKEIDAQLKSDLLDALQPAFARISEQGIRYSALPGRNKELTEAIREELAREWGEDKGIEVQRVSISSVKADEEDEKMIKEMQRNAAFMDPTRGAAHLVAATGDAMKTAAGNSAGAMTGFLGMNMAQGTAGVNAQSLYQVGQQMQQNTPMPQPKAAEGWTCPNCGNVSSGKFCTECGTKKPEEGWVCSCGAKNQGKFCSECGAKKPAGVPQYKCDKCGWEPEKGSKPPKFCPECGDPFDNGDLI